jgi:DHA2 family multidrug resistance protein
VAITVWQDRAAMHHAQLAEYIHRGNPAAMETLAGMQGAGLTETQALAQINRMLDQQAYMLAANDVFYVSAAIFMCLVPIVWLAKPKRAAQASVAEAVAH